MPPGKTPSKLSTSVTAGISAFYKLHYRPLRKHKKIIYPMSHCLLSHASTYSIFNRTDNEFKELENQINVNWKCVT